MKISSAEFNKDHSNRFSLTRIWNELAGIVMFIGLNPSTANESEDDPTIRSIIRWAKYWDYGGIYMTNLFTQITAYPEELINITNEIPKENIDLLLSLSAKSAEIVFAWGRFKQAKERAGYIYQLFPNAMVMGFNNDGSPRHPLFLKASTPLIPCSDFPLSL